jgi:hypothetical protein
MNSHKGLPLRFRIPFLLLLLSSLITPGRSARAQEARSIPAALQPWESWATWNDTHRFCPTPYSDPKVHRCFWPSRLELQVTPSSGRFSMMITAFHDTWVPLPGGAEVWPQEVQVGGRPVVVVERDGAPSVQVAAGDTRLEGRYLWNEPPQNLRIPAALGILSLSRDGQAVENPAWDAQGLLWLRRDASTETAERNFMGVKLFSVLEDGIPLWWRQEVELTVAGKSREEDLGILLPEGWRLAAIQSPIPVSVDDSGHAKAQVRAGTWTFRVDAFRWDNPREIQFARGSRRAAPEALVAFRARPDFRVLEFIGPPAIDPTQSYFPKAWQGLPVYRWDTAAAVRLVERMRGMGTQKPAGLSIERVLWLDEGGQGMTFQDRILGQMQQVWRLDAAEGQELGSVRSGGEGQLITRNPQNGAVGVELRSRTLDVEATGRLTRPDSLPATGWRSDAESVRVTLHLPPGWRLFALFGADWVQGDWLTAWTLLDLFLLLIFTLAVFRIRGWATALLAFAAFGLAYHEPGAPRYLWLVMLVPIALEPHVPRGIGLRLLHLAQAIAIGTLLFFLVPFVARQVQQALYPQLEIADGTAAPIPRQSVEAEMLHNAPLDPRRPGRPAIASAGADSGELLRRYGLASSASPSTDSGVTARPVSQAAFDNLRQDVKARIQTGPGIPEWTWRSVSFGWNGPVQGSQRLRPVLIAQPVERVLTVLRTILLLALGAALLRGVRRSSKTPDPATSTTPTPPPAGTPGAHPAATPVVGLLLLLMGFITSTPPVHAQAQAPAAAPSKAVPAVPIQAPAAVPPAVAPASVAVPPAAMAAPSYPTPIPDATTLETLRKRLLEHSDAFPNAATLARVFLGLTGQRLRMEAEFHCATEVAVPLPGRLPAYSPLNVTVNNRWTAVLRRDDGYLWVVLPAGVHSVRMEALLTSNGDWEWTYLLKPRQVQIDAPDWTVVGVRPDGIPEQQVFFAPKQKVATPTATYERQDLQAIVAVERRLELGLQWQIRTVIHRLSPPGKAVSLRIPLLSGENVLTQGRVVQEGGMEVRLGAQETEFSWESSLAPVESLTLATRPTDTWVERWHLVASPVWNVSLTGLAPVFETGHPELEPVWQPWPGETVSLKIHRPEAIAGATVTVHRALHEVTLGQRQRLTTLHLDIRCSLGEDFLIDLPAEADVTRLTHLGQEIPVRREGSRLVIPLRPGEQRLSVGWKENRPLDFRADNGAVRLPVESANIQSSLGVGEDRWVLWASGPRRGPAVRFWSILITSLLAALALGRIPGSPLRPVQWMLLGIGLTQVPLLAAFTVIGWFFVFRWRGQPRFQTLPWFAYNGAQALLVGLTAATVGILLFAVSAGLLGNPKMFILGNGSTSTLLRWFQARSDGSALPVCDCVSVSIWWYRFAMLLWALWLAVSVLGWLGRAWKSFASGGFLRHWPRKTRSKESAPASTTDRTASTEIPRTEPTRSGTPPPLPAKPPEGSRSPEV